MAERRRVERNGPDPKAFPIQLRVWRERRGFRDAASLARHLSVPASTITRLERGERRPSLAILCRVSQALDVPLDYLVRTTEELPEAEFREDDRQTFEQVRRKLFQFTERLGRKDGNGGSRVLWELSVWLDHMTKHLRSRLKNGNRNAKTRR